MTFSLELTAMALIALILDAAIGGVGLIGRFPGPDRLFHVINEKLSLRLDIIHRSDNVRIIRGGLITLIGLVILLPLGSWLSDTVTADKTGTVIGILLLMLILGQRAAVDTAAELITILADVGSREDHSRFDAARWGIERLVLRLNDGLICNIIVLFFTGLPGLLFYRFLTMIVAIGAPSGILKPASPYYKIPFLLYEAITIIPASVSMLLITLAAIFVPGARINLLASIEEKVSNAIIGRKLPLMAMAHSMTFSFRQDPNEARQKTVWVGPKDGRSKLEATDLRNALYLIIATWALSLIMLAMMAFPMIYRI